MNKKLKKLIRDPGLFFHDMFLKREIKAPALTTSVKKAVTRYNYEIVIVVNENVFNLQRCLDSVYEQKNVDYEKINISILNLGVTPEQCEYIQTLGSEVKVFSEENELDYLSFTSSLQNNYTMFVWGDDFIDSNFIQITDKFLLADPKKNRRGSVICTSVLKANSTSEVGRNYNPITALYSKLSSDNVLPAQMAVESIYGCLFPTGVLKAILRKQMGFGCLRFDGLGIFFDIFRSLPDTRRLTISAKSRYLVHEDNVAHLFKDNTWGDPSLFSEHFILLCEKFSRNLPGAKKWQIFLRRSFFHMLLKYIKKGLANQSLLDNITHEDKEKFLDSFKRSIELIGIDCINKFNIACAEQFKVGCFNLIGKKRISSAVDIIQYDIDKDMFMLRYYTSLLVTEYFTFKNIDSIPVIDKCISHNLFGEVFFIERVVWLSSNKNIISNPLSIKIDHQLIKIRGLDRKIVNSISPLNIRKQHNALKPKFKTSANYRNAWIFMDRDNQADDNAEHLYRYVHNMRPDIPAWFVLQRESHDWQRLSDEGFHLLAFGEPEHEKALESCSRVISSHAAQFATDYFKDKRMTWKKFVFLQHGIIHNDQSALFKPDWKKFDMFVTSSFDEYKSIVDDMSPYKFTAKEAVLTGLPRHDALINSQIKSEKMILVMPTWRPSLLGKVISGTERELLPDFTESEYAKAWYDILANDDLKITAEKYGYKIVFFPHANIQPYLDQYVLPEHVTVLSHSSGSIQELFLKASVMITDYSSVAFEMAYLNKPVCYYQFDEDAFFNKGHYNKGYFSYRENGFGPVYNDEENTVNFVVDMIKANCVMSPYYTEKANKFFPYRDGKCCERTVAAIESLDNKMLDDSIFENSGESKGKFKAVEWAMKAYDDKNIVLSNRRYSSVLSENKGDDRFDGIDSKYICNYVDILLHLGYLDKAKIIIDAVLNLSDVERNKLKSKYELIYNILMESAPTSPVTHYDDIERVFYNKLFAPDTQDNNKIYHDFLRECDETLLQLIDDNPMGAVRYLLENSELFEFNTLNSNVLMYRILDLAGRYDYINKNYLKLSSINKQNILIKFIYLRALYKMNKWGLIMRFIGASSILQGRTSIPLFASCYFFGMRGARKKIAKIEDFSCFYESPLSLQEDYRLDILKYFLYIHNDLHKAKLFVDECFDSLPVRIIEDFAYKLCSSNLTDESYGYFKRINVNDLSVKNIILFGELAMSYGEYDVAVSCFQQACLSKLPSVDNELKKRLSVARLWANENTTLLIKMSLS